MLSLATLLSETTVNRNQCNPQANSFQSFDILTKSSLVMKDDLILKRSCLYIYNRGRRHWPTMWIYYCGSYRNLYSDTMIHGNGYSQMLV